jgi:beta-lactam-binding protein with PASTA domain
MPGIFISYRREDSAGHTGRLFDRLRARLGHDRVFMDITGIEAGFDFVDTIERAIGSCDVLLAVIGPEWLTCADSRGRPRLEDPNDLIRIEIVAALTRKVRVIPVLIAGAAMPSAQSLPDDLRPLARRQATELRDTKWDPDTGDLIGVLERVLSTSAPAESDLKLNTISQRSSVAAAPSPRYDVRDRRSIWRWVAALAFCMMAAAIAIVFLNPSLLPPFVNASLLRPDAETRPSSSALNSSPSPPETASRGGASNSVQPTDAPSSRTEGGRVQVEGSNVDVAANAAKTVRVPRVEGVTLRLAAQALRGAGLAVGTQESVSAPVVSPFVVTKQTPAAGTIVPRYARVNLLYARPLRTLPIVTNQTLDDAVAELRASGFEPGLLTPRPTDKVRPQQVLEQSRPAGAELEPGTKIDLVYAVPLTTVPDKRGLKVPNVQRLTVQEAQTTLERAGLTPQITYEVTDRARPDTVIRQSPPPDFTSTSDKPVVELFVARALTSTISLSINYNTDAERDIAQNLSTYLGGYKFAGYRILQVKGPSTLSPGVVHYQKQEHERLAQSVASRAQSWLSKTYNQSIVLTPQLNPRLRPDLIIIYLPRSN